MATPTVEAFTAIVEADADGAEVRRILEALPTPDLARAESCAVRLIWAARDVRSTRTGKP